MSEFFEPPPGPPVPEHRYRLPSWLGAPPGTLPGVVALERVLARTADVAVCVTRVAAYPTGFELDLVTMTANDGADFDPLHSEGHRRRPGASDEIAPEFLRFGVRFADGSKATNLSRGFHAAEDPRPGRSWSGAAAAAAEAGARRSGSGRCRRQGSSRSSENGRPRGFPSRAANSTRAPSSTPPSARR